MESSYCVLFSSMCNFAFCFRICYQLFIVGFKSEVDQNMPRDLNWKRLKFYHCFQTLSNFNEIIGHKILYKHTNIFLTNEKSEILSVNQGFFLTFWEGALGPFALGIFRHFNRNWENFFDHFYMIFLNRDPKAALNHSCSWLYALFWLKVHWKGRQFVNLLIYIKITFWLGTFWSKLGKNVGICHWDRGLITAPETPEKNPW